MRHAKLFLLAFVVALPGLGCGGSKPKPVAINELTPDQIAAQEATLKEAEMAERTRQKNAPKEKTADQLAEESERGRRR